MINNTREKEEAADVQGMIKIKRIKCRDVRKNRISDVRHNCSIYWMGIR